MTSTAQIEANRINSLSSTGPRTPEGKATSSHNATSHGLSSAGGPVLPHESGKEFNLLMQSYVWDVCPEGTHELFLVSEMVGARWRMHRADRLLNIVLSGQLDEPAENDGGDPEIRIARMMAAKGDPTARLERHRAALERTYHRCVRELRNSKKFRDAQQPSAASLAPPARQNKPNPGDAKTYLRPQPKIGRNDYCPCGSGLKYKKCCLNATAASTRVTQNPATLTAAPASHVSN